jgi:hypothetical protein
LGEGGGGDGERENWNRKKVGSQVDVELLPDRVWLTAGLVVGADDGDEVGELHGHAGGARLPDSARRPRIVESGSSSAEDRAPEMPSKEMDIPLDDEAREWLRIRFTTESGRMTRFTVQH